MFGSCSPEGDAKKAIYGGDYLSKLVEKRTDECRVGTLSHLVPFGFGPDISQTRMLSITREWTDKCGANDVPRGVSHLPENYLVIWS